MFNYCMVLALQAYKNTACSSPSAGAKTIRSSNVKLTRQAFSVLKLLFSYVFSRKRFLQKELRDTPRARGTKRTRSLRSRPRRTGGDHETDSLDQLRHICAAVRLLCVFPSDAQKHRRERHRIAALGVSAAAVRHLPGRAADQGDAYVHHHDRYETSPTRTTSAGTRRPPPYNIVIPYKIGELYRIFLYGSAIGSYVGGIVRVLTDRLIDTAALLTFLTVLLLSRARPFCRCISCCSRRSSFSSPSGSRSRRSIASGTTISLRRSIPRAPEKY